MGDPVVTTFQLPSLPANNYAYTDLSQCASMMNRKFYRQGLQWAVGGFTFMSAAGASGKIAVEKLPDTWVMANAWVKGFKMWQDQNREALRVNESIAPKFHDFKIYMDSVHHADGVALNKTPVAFGGAAYVRGEWDYSTISQPITDPGATNFGGAVQREIIAIGASYPGLRDPADVGTNAVSLIEGYAASRALPDILDPNVPDDAVDMDGGTPENWMAAMFNDGSQADGDTVDALISQNVTAPYPFENGPNPAGGAFGDTQYPGGANNPVGGGTLEIHDFATVSATTVGQKTTLRGGTFQCGLMKISNDTDQDMDILIHLVPGNHRGYLAMPMTEVN